MPELTEDVGVISSIIVQTRPETLSKAAGAIERLQGAEIFGDDPCGKLVVVIETDNDAELTGLIERIGKIEGVLGVNMVFHHNELAPADDYKGTWRG